MISIIIPVYNVEKYLSVCLDSILAQTYKDYEVILVDDGSTDNSSVICDDYAKKNICIQVIHQPNAGVSVARNKGIECARGEWITFVDSDDWLDIDFLASFNLQTDTELSITGLKYIHYPESIVLKIWSFKETEISLSCDFEAIAENNLLEYGTVCCKAYKKQVMDTYKIRFDENLSYHEDHLLLFQYLHHVDRVSFHRAIGYNYRITSSGQSLSSKIHPWAKLNASGDAMFWELKHLFFFRFLPQWYIRKLTTFCLEPKVAASRSVFVSNLTENEKKRAIKTIIKDSNLLKEYYHPKGLKNKLQKICLLEGYMSLKVFYAIVEIVKKISRR